MSGICLKCGKAKVEPGVPVPANAQLCSCVRPDVMPMQVPVRARKGEEAKPKQFVSADRLELLEELNRCTEEIADVEEAMMMCCARRDAILEKLRTTP